MVGTWKRWCWALTLCVGFVFVGEAEAQTPERSYHQLRYVSDPGVPLFPPNAEVCARAPFEANGYVEGGLSTFAADSHTGEVVESSVRGVGRARACIQFQDLSFAPFAHPVPIYWELEVEGIGAFTANGYCMPSNNADPVPGLILGGCVMQLMTPPPGYLGGNLVEGGVVLNPFALPGYEYTSSFMTLHLFK